MKKLVLLGGSVAALQAVEILRDRDRLPDQVVMLLADSNTIAVRDRYTDGVIGQQKPRQLCYRAEDKIIAGGIDIVSDKTATRVNVTRQKIHFDDRSQMDYHMLIIADTPAHKMDSIKGHNKEGVFGYIEPGHMNQIGTLAALNDSITIQSDRWWGVDLALRLGKKGKDVTLSLSGQHPLVRSTDQEFRDGLTAALREQNIGLQIDNGIEEILGDSDVKAVKMRSGKVFAAQVVVLDEARPDLRIFSEGLDMDADRITVDECYRTNIPNVFAVDFVAQRSDRLWQNYGPQTGLLEYQGQVLADVISEYAEFSAPPVPQTAIGSQEYRIVSAGQLVEGRSVTSQCRTDPRGGRLVRIFVRDDIVVGALAAGTDIPAERLFACVQGGYPAEMAWDEFAAAIAPEASADPAGDETPDVAAEGSSVPPEEAGDVPSVTAQEKG